MFIIDRFEGDWAVIEFNRQTFNLPRKLLPPGAMEGDVISISVKIDGKATASVKDEVMRLARRIFKD